MTSVELLFLGTGTSVGIPMIGCHCDVCRSADPRDRRLRPSVLVSCAGHNVVIDTTPEFRLQCLAHSIEKLDAAVFTHGHADHIMGLDDLRRFNALHAGPLDVWADEATHAVLTRCFSYAFIEPLPEVRHFRPHLIRRIINGAFQVGTTRWTPVPLLHGTQPVLGFRIGGLAYCTDVSAIPESSFALLQDLDILILDALQHRRHTTHFALEEAIAAATRIGARRTFFTHIAHALGHDATNKMLPKGMALAYDGLRITAGE